MKKTLSLLLGIVILMIAFPCSVSAAELPNEDALASPHIALYNPVNDRFVYTKAAKEKVFPSTTAKIMTAILAFEYFEGRLDTKITVTAAALKGLSGSAVLNLEAGEEIPVYDLLYAMLTAGMNDAANVLAIAIGGTLSEFAVLMNQKAKDLGAETTNYVNPTGFDMAGAYTTAADTARIAAHAYENPIFMQMCSARAYTVPATNLSPAVTIYTRNSLLTSQSDYFYKNAEGISTGYTDMGGYTVVSAASYGIYPYVCVVMGAKIGENGTIGAYADVKKLLSWAGDNFLERKLLDSSKIVAELPILAGKNDHVLIVPDAAVYGFLDKDIDLSQIEYSVNLDTESLKAPVKKGMIVGSIWIILDGDPIASTHLVTKNEVRQSPKGAFLLTLKTIVTHPVFILCVIGCLIIAGFIIYRKNFHRKKLPRRL